MQRVPARHTLPVYIRLLLILSLIPAAAFATTKEEPLVGPETIVVRSGTVILRGLLWCPGGRGPFPAVLFNHGSGNTLEHQTAQAERLGRLFATHGYDFLYLFRRGSGLSADAGTSAIERMDRELAAHGQDARNRLQLRMLEGDSLEDAVAGLAYLRKRADVDPHALVLVGHSYGASLTLLMAEHESSLRAAVAFSGSAASWDHSPQLQARLLAAVDRTSVPIFFIQAANDYSIAPTNVLSAEMKRQGKIYQARIYPAVGRNADEGHDFVDLGVAVWEADVFSFLDAYVRH